MMNCKKCEVELERIEKGNFIIFRCPKCGDFNKDFECNKHKLEYVKTYHADGSPHVKKQCFNCGHVINKLVPKHEVKEFPNIPKLNDEIIENPERSSVLLELSKIKIKIAKNENLDAFLEVHSKYLKSDKWKKKRALVLKRDNYLCQACLEEKATEVHHLSYKFWRNEPLFDLVSICTQCHEYITKISREELEQLQKLI